MKTKEEIEEINKQQAEYYNKDHAKRPGNVFSRLWSNFRNGPLNDYVQNFDMKDRIYSEHKRWFGELKDKKVLDLGCFSGNALSLYLAENAKEYIGIDLSDVAINKLQHKIEERGFSNARALAVDFLSDDFDERDFDLVYAFGVMHHFENFDLLVQRINEVTRPEGKIITYDPLETSLPVRVLRRLYRPFQSDADWEWPFTRSTLRKIANAFDVVEVHGLLGKSKYGLPYHMLPLPDDGKKKTIQSWIDRDWNATDIMDVTPCMHLTMLLQRKADK